MEFYGTKGSLVNFDGTGGIGSTIIAQLCYSSILNLKIALTHTQTIFCSKKKTKTSASTQVEE
jgi:hypothetical protein